MDRTVLSKRLAGLSEVFASGSNFGEDLKAMSYVLENMPEEKYSQLVNADYQEEKEAWFQAPMQGPDRSRMKREQIMEQRKKSPGGAAYTPEQKVVKLDEMIQEEKDPAIISMLKKIKERVQKAVAPMTVAPEGVQAMGGEYAMDGEYAAGEGETMGMYWNREASNAVQQNLLRDVLGMDKSICCDTNQKLEKKQMPDGEKKAEKPATLKDEQTPDVGESLDSDMDKKVKDQEIRKEAGSVKGPGKPDGTGPYSGKEECPMSKKEKEENVEAMGCGKKEATEEIEAANKDYEKEPGRQPQEEGDIEEKHEEKSAVDDSVLVAEGIELNAPMEDVVLAGEEEDTLSKLFD